MNDKKPLGEEIKDKIKDSAKAVEDFADKVTADEKPVKIVPEGTPDPGPARK